MEITNYTTFQRVHSTCINNTVLKGNLFFKLIDLKKGEVFQQKTEIGLYYLFFILNDQEIKMRRGRTNIIQNSSVFCEIGGKEIQLEALTDVSIVLHVFNDIINICDREFLSESENGKPSKNPVKINDPLERFLHLLLVYMENDTCCYQVNKLKHKELFMIFRRFYTEEEYYSLFSPVINDDKEFRKAVKDHYMKAKNINELAAYCNKSLSTFIRLFKKQFNDNPHNWIKKQKLQLIIDRLSDKDIELTAIVDEFDFSSFSYFSQYCKHHLGKTPKDYRKQILK